MTFRSQDERVRTVLGNHLRIRHGFAFKGELFKDDGPYIVLTPGNFRDEGGFKSKEPEKYYVGDPPAEYVLRGGDLIVAMTEQSYGLLGSPAFVPEDDLYLHNQRLGLVVDLDEARLDKRYLYYLMNTASVRNQIQATATGSKVRHTAPSRIESVEVSLPRVSVQRRIGKVLSAYDDLIENNTRRIEILEAMAQATYREWFVNFRFPGHGDVAMVEAGLGQIPKGWAPRPLMDVADVTYGFAFKSKLFNEDSEGLPVVRIRNILAGQSQTFTTQEADQKYLIEDGDILVGMDGTFHRGKWWSGPAYLNQRVARFRPREGLSRAFLYLALKDPIEFLNATISGTTVAHLSDRRLREVHLSIPPEDVLRVANEVLEPLFELELTLSKANSVLRETRDLLLFKLISGDISVEHLDSTPDEAVA